MPEWGYELVEAFAAAVGNMSLLDALALAVLGTIVVPVVVLIHTLAIALAGPLASLAGALITGAVAVWAWPELWLSLLFGLATLGGLVLGVGNLRRHGDGPETWSDGVWVRAAWRAMRTA